MENLQRVLEVQQHWGDSLVDTQHFNPDTAGVTVGSSMGYRWEFLGVNMGWVPSPLHLVLPYAPPVLSDVVLVRKTDFHAAPKQLPLGEAHELFSWKDGRCVADVADGWKAKVTTDDGWIDVEGEVVMTPGASLEVQIDQLVFTAALVDRARRVPRGTGDLDHPFLAIGSFMSFVGLMFGLVVFFAPRAAQSDLVEIPDHFVNMLMERDEPVKPEPKPREQVAEEGAKPPEEEGKAGKRDASKAKAKGARNDKRKADLAAVNDAGIFKAGVQGAGEFDPLVAAMAGGFIGSKGHQRGYGGYGSRGGAFGGGGKVDALDGLGTGNRGPGYGKNPGLGPHGDGEIVDVLPPVLVGHYPRSLVDETIKRHIASIRHCYQKELTRDPTLAGKVGINFTIANDGSVSRAKIYEATLDNAAVQQCLTERFYRLTFPKPKVGVVIVKYPFLFAPG
jgi:hypothetical protein